MSSLSSRSTYLLLIGIACLSFWLRLWGAEFGLPFAYHPDEQQYILPAVGVVSGNFKPLAHYNPALYPYVIGLVYALTYLGLRLFNAFPEFFNLSAAWSDPMLPWTTGLIYLARYTSVAAGLLTTLMVYRLGRCAYGRVSGLGAAIIFGWTFLPAREAHFAVSDAPVALGVAATLYLALNILRRGHWSDYGWTGLALGLATATKYSAGLLLLPLAVAHLLSQKYRNWSDRLINTWRVLLAGLTAVAAYLLTSPYTLLEREKFWANFSENLESARSGFQGLQLDPSENGGLFYLKGLIWGLGWPLFLLLLAAVLFALWRRRRVDLLLLTLPLLGFFYMQRQEMYFVRWLMPFLPPIAVLAAETARAGVAQIAHSRLSNKASRWPEFINSYGAITIITLFTLPSTYMAGRADYVFSHLDTRTQALEWIRQHIPPGSNLAAEVLSPPWGPPLAMPGLAIGPYQFAPTPEGGVMEEDLAQYRAWGAQYVIASSFYYARPLLDEAHQAGLTRHLQTFEQSAQLVALFQPYLVGQEYTGFLYHDQVYGPANDALSRERPGPVIKIYRLP